MRLLLTSDLEVMIEDLKKSCDPNLFPFKDTSELEPLAGIIGQDRAERAIRFGLDVPFDGYNLFLCGPRGTGKNTVALEHARKKACERPVPADWCYVHNFSDPDRPIAVKLPGGNGKKFVRDMENLVKGIKTGLHKVFNSEEYEQKKSLIVGDFYEKTNKLYAEVEEVARSKGFTVTRSQTGFATVPINNQDGEPLTPEQFGALEDDEKKQLMEQGRLLQERINEGLRKYRELERLIRDRMMLLEQETARNTVAPLICFMYERYRDHSVIVSYMEALHQDILDNIGAFSDAEDVQNPMVVFRQMEKKHFLRRYSVNLIIDNSDSHCAPVIVEKNPSFSRLFGSVEYEGEFGVLSTDFTKIKGGAMHRANGGFLILDFMDLIQNYLAWETLKRIIKSSEIGIESVYKSLSMSGGESLEPQPIPIDIKVILMGEPYIYYLLQHHDPEFAKLFKVRVEFDTEMHRELEQIMQYASFVANICRTQKLPHFTAQAVARLVDFGAWLVEDQNMLSVRLNKVHDLVLESAMWAMKNGSQLVQAEDVDRAISEKVYRSNMIEDKIMKLFQDGTLLMEVDGTRIGEINGLAVYDMGDYMFGKPSRITAKTFMGEKGVINIEREVRMSGTIHTKGVLTLGGYLGAKYAQDKPLSLSASLTFEQTYEGIEGDSASSAELYALISSLARVPIRQGIAVTGSVNQNGEIQPIGGVNQKIAGFFKVCKIKGLTGQQGVMIPRQNVSNLMLEDEVLDHIRRGMFHIWAVESIDQGIEILMGTPAGKENSEGEYSKGTVHYLVDSRLREWGENRRQEKNRRVRSATRKSHIRRP